MITAALLYVQVVFGGGAVYAVPVGDIARPSFVQAMGLPQCRPYELDLSPDPTETSA